MIEAAYTPILLYKSESPELAPARAHSTDAGLDLRAKALYNIFPGERVLVGTGVSVSIPDGYVGLLFARSSLSKKGLMLSNSVGVIDSSYRGEIMASMIFVPTNNLNQEFAQIEPLERVVQLVIAPIQLAIPVAVNTLEDTARGSGGFGSTGKL